MSHGFPALPNIEFLIDGDGEITIGSIASIPCAATASDDHQSFAMLVRREDESLEQLLIRLDRAIAMAVEDEIFIDEINYGQDDRL
jgi:hypothetical protein